MAEEGPSLELPRLAELFRDFVRRIVSGDDDGLEVEFARQSLPPPPSEAREERLVIRKGFHFYDMTRFDIALFYGSKQDYCGLGVAILSALFHRTELAVHLAHPASEIRRLVVDGASGWQVEPILCDVGALTWCPRDPNDAKYGWRSSDRPYFVLEWEEAPGPPWTDQQLEQRDLLSCQGAGGLAHFSTLLLDLSSRANQRSRVTLEAGETLPATSTEIRLYLPADEGWCDWDQNPEESGGFFWYTSRFPWVSRTDNDRHEETVEDCTRAIELGRKTTCIYNSRGYAWYCRDEYDKAIEDYTKAIALDPEDAAAYFNRGSAWQSKGEYDKAIADYDRVIELDPEDADAYFSRGDVWDIRGEYEKAIADCSRAIDLEPDNADAYNQLAWLRSTCPESGFRDAQAAIESALRACELTNWQDWNILDTLAAAYAETGDFESAVCWVTKALELAPETEKAVEQNRLELYQSGTPYREE